jgi:hypothetical protein
MRLAKKLADRIVFLHEAQAIFFGTYDEMEKCEEPIVQEFLKLDEPGIEASDRSDLIEGQHLNWQLAIASCTHQSPKIPHAPTSPL